MAARIIAPSSELRGFMDGLQLPLNRPQFQHVLEIADAFLVCEGEKTFAALNRELVDPRDVYAIADCFRESPWKADDLRQPLYQYLLPWAFGQLGEAGPVPLYLGLDDSLSPKPKTSRHFESVDWHHDHTKGPRAYTNGAIYVALHLQAGRISLTVNWRLYLREQTVRRLNRQRPPERRLRYASKFTLAKEMLSEIAPYLPEGWPVYVLFDSWYASAKLLKYCRRNGWHVLCGLRKNRCLEGKQVREHNRALRNTRYTRVTVTSATSSQTYLTRRLQGRLEGFADEVRIVISKRHNRDKSPEYFLSTDLSLREQEVLTRYGYRWPVEIDNLYLKDHLGVGDFRTRSHEGIEKYMAVVFLVLAYLQVRQAQLPQPSSLADVIRQHRAEHHGTLLREVVNLALETGSAEAVLARFLPQT